MYFWDRANALLVGTTPSARLTKPKRQSSIVALGACSDEGFSPATTFNKQDRAQEKTDSDTDLSLKLMATARRE